MANIKIAELQSSLLEEVSVIDLDAVHGGKGVQVTGVTTGIVIGFTNGGSSKTISDSGSLLTGTVDNFSLQFRTFTSGFTSPT